MGALGHSGPARLGVSRLCWDGNGWYMWSDASINPAPVRASAVHEAMICCA